MDQKYIEAIFRMIVKIARSIDDDQEALSIKCLYKEFDKVIGKPLELNEYIQYNDKLYKVIQAHTA